MTAAVTLTANSNLESAHGAAFWRGYLYAVAFTARDEKGAPVWESPSGDIRDAVAPKDVERALAEAETYWDARNSVESFLAGASALLAEEAGEDLAKWESAGVAFHLSSNGYGGGFRDGGWPLYGERLYAMANARPPLALLHVTADREAGRPYWVVQGN